MSADKVTLPSSAPAAPAASATQANVSVSPLGGKPAGIQQLPDGKTTLVGRFDITPDPAPAQPAPQSGDRPGWLPEKFKSPEDLAKAYGELERRMSGGQPAPQPAPAPSADPAGAGGPANQALIQKLTEAYSQTGEISPELRKEFVQKTGLPEEIIDQQVGYLQAQGRRATDMARERLGGDQAVRELLSWADQRLTNEDREAFNRMVHSRDEAMARLAIDGLAAKFEAEVGRSPKVIAGRRPQQDMGGVVPFQSHAEWEVARKDKRYKEDPAYRQHVEERLRAADRLGII